MNETDRNCTNHTRTTNSEKQNSHQVVTETTNLLTAQSKWKNNDRVGPESETKNGTHTWKGENKNEQGKLRNDNDIL